MTDDMTIEEQKEESAWNFEKTKITGEYEGFELELFGGVRAEAIAGIVIEVFLGGKATFEIAGQASFNLSPEYEICFAKCENLFAGCDFLAGKYEVNAEHMNAKATQTKISAAREAVNGILANTGVNSATANGAQQNVAANLANAIAVQTDAVAARLASAINNVNNIIDSVKTIGVALETVGTDTKVSATAANMNVMKNSLAALNVVV